MENNIVTATVGFNPTSIKPMQHLMNALTKTTYKFWKVKVLYKGGYFHYEIKITTTSKNITKFFKKYKNPEGKHITN